jgi:acyl-CoA synthetase (NDP forming)/RimJ/RimL family protein N-acetyltransferase
MSMTDLDDTTGTTPLRADVILRDGRTLRLREPGHDDRAALTTFLRRLSSESLRMRFFATLRPDERLIDPYLDSKWDQRGALMGTLTVGADERVIALASYARLRDPRAAEVAFAVADAEHGVGIATRMLEQLARRASREGIERFIFEILPTNAAMLRVVADSGFEVSRETANGVVEVAMSIEPTATYAGRVDERDHIGVAASLARFLDPASIAVYGASARGGTIGGELFRNVLRGGYARPAYPINRSGAAVDGVPGRSTLRGVEPTVDLAFICVPADVVFAAVEDALSAGTRSICVVSAGFAEVGADGRDRQDAVLALVRAHGGRLIGPNCLGIAAGAASLNATFAAQAPPRGNVGFASQSGALGLAVVEQARGRGLGLSSFVSLGNKADVSSNDLLEYWEDDAATSVVALYLESFGNPLRFGRIARRVARKKPVLALKGGATAAGARAAASHTAALASSDVAVDALFRQAGVQRTRTLTEFLDAAALLSSQPLPAGGRVAVVTNAGGLGILCADACAAEGLELSRPSPATSDALRLVVPAEASLENPIDLLGSATAETFAAVLPMLLADPAFDAICVLFVRPIVAAAADVIAAVDAAIEAAGHEKPVVGVFLSAESGADSRLARNVTTFGSPEAAAVALGVAARRADWLRQPAGSVPELAGIDRDSARAIAAEALQRADDAWLDARESRILLEAYGIRLAPEAIADTPDHAARAATVLGMPVVVKSAAPGAHKTESGGVALDLRDEEAVRQAAVRIGCPVLVQPMLGGAELLVGATQDPTFGPLVAIGLGGVQAELIGAVSFALAPLTDTDAVELLTAGALGRLVKGFRGRPPLASDVLADLLHRLSALTLDLPEVAELDLNPIVVDDRGYCAIDRRVRVRRHTPVPRLKTW